MQPTRDLLRGRRDVLTRSVLGTARGGTVAVATFTPRLGAAGLQATAVNSVRLGTIYEDLGRTTEALSSYDTALDRFSRLMGSDMQVLMCCVGARAW